jgi:hypothetical protein
MWWMTMVSPLNSTLSVREIEVNPYISFVGIVTNLLHNIPAEGRLHQILYQGRKDYPHSIPEKGREESCKEGRQENYWSSPREASSGERSAACL